MRRAKERSLLAALVLFGLIAGCSSEVVRAEYRSLPGSWPEEQEVQFELPELDSLRTYNLFINLRNTNDYPFNNIFLITTMEFPHGKTVVDTLEYRMAYPDGSWMGTGLGSVKDNKLWYKEGVRFFEEGNYKLRIKQAVRNNGEVGGVKELRGIAEVGYSIERANP
jgi:gliding motility-associated lipoprotein GldH